MDRFAKLNESATMSGTSNGTERSSLAFPASSMMQIAPERSDTPKAGCTGSVLGAWLLWDLPVYACFGPNADDENSLLTSVVDHLYQSTLYRSDLRRLLSLRSPTL